MLSKGPSTCQNTLEDFQKVLSSLHRRPYSWFADFKKQLASSATAEGPSRLPKWPLWLSGLQEVYQVLIMMYQATIIL